MNNKIKENLKIFTKTHRKIGILLDSIKSIIIVLILVTLIAFFASAIIHNIFRVIEASNEYRGKYKQLYTSGDRYDEFIYGRKPEIEL